MECQGLDCQGYNCSVAGLTLIAWEMHRTILVPSPLCSCSIARYVDPDFTPVQEMVAVDAVSCPSLKRCMWIAYANTCATSQQTIASSDTSELISSSLRRLDLSLLYTKDMSKKHIPHSPRDAQRDSFSQLWKHK